MQEQGGPLKGSHKLKHETGAVAMFPSTRESKLVRGWSDGPGNRTSGNGMDFVEPMTRRRRGSSWERNRVRESVMSDANQRTDLVQPKRRAQTLPGKGLKQQLRSDETDDYMEDTPTLVSPFLDSMSQFDSQDKIYLKCSHPRPDENVDSMNANTGDSISANHNGINSQTFQAIVLDPLVRDGWPRLDLGGLASGYEWLGDTYTIKLMETAALSCGHQLEFLNLAGNLISDVGAKAIASSLGSLPALVELGLASNLIGDDGVIALAKALTSKDRPSNIRTLNLEDNRFGLKGIMSLTDALSVPKSNDNASVLHSQAGPRCAVTELELASNNIDDEQACLLAGALQTNAGLQRLGLALNVIGCQGARALGAALPSNYNLLELDLSGNVIDAEGCCSLAQGLARNSTLRALSLRQNSCGGRGAAALTLALSDITCATKQTKSALRSLDLRGNGIARAPLEALAKIATQHCIDAKLLWPSTQVFATTRPVAVSMMHRESPSPAESLGESELHTDASDCESIGSPFGLRIDTSMI